MASKIIQASIRDFARNPDIRKKAEKSNSPIMLFNKRAEEVFFLFPPKLYEKMYSWYQDMRDEELLKKAMKQPCKAKDWEELKKELSIQ